MRVTGGRRTAVAAAVGMALALGAGEAHGQVAGDSCELTVVLGAPRDTRPWATVEVLVTDSTADAPQACGPIARAVALSFMQSGENVYVRGFGSFIIKKITPRARPKEPKLSRAE